MLTFVTGHYIKRNMVDGEAQLYMADDYAKDQSYFLFTTTNEQLDYLRFPLGDFNKTQVREIARDLKVTVADKKESQDICFVQGKSYKDYILQFNKNNITKGKILHIDGRELGEHNGIINYTVGQRRGIGIDNVNEAMYVLKINAHDNSITIGPKHSLEQESLYIKDCNWLCNPVALQDKQYINVKLRAKHKNIAASIEDEGNNRFKVTFSTPQTAVTPGQACVVYDKNRLLGGGWIEAKHN